MDLKGHAFGERSKMPKFLKQLIVPLKKKRKESKYALRRDIGRAF